jgi:hypothetical protein
MARAGHKYPLIVYRHMLNRWWPAMLVMGLVVLLLAYSEYTSPLAQFISWRWQVLGAIGILSIFVGLFFLVIKNLAYVQPLPNSLKLVTPFMRLKISYKRIRKTTASEMHYLFPKNSLSGWMQDIFAPLANKTAIIVELTGYPVSPVLLRTFLSRFFFKDKTPHLVILVKDWMRFSAELESMRSGVDPNPPGQKRPPTSILSRLPQK